MNKFETLVDLTLEEGFSFLYRLNPFYSKNILYKGHRIWVDYKRLKTFKKSNRCIYCGKEGNIFKIQKSGNWEWHLNMWRIDKSGQILFTLDHKLPKSLGGNKNLRNLQTCCLSCNNKKSNVYITLN